MATVLRTEKKTALGICHGHNLHKPTRRILKKIHIDLAFKLQHAEVLVIMSFLILLIEFSIILNQNESV